MRLKPPHGRHVYQAQTNPNPSPNNQDVAPKRPNPPFVGVKHESENVGDIGTAKARFKAGQTLVPPIFMAPGSVTKAAKLGTHPKLGPQAHFGARAAIAASKRVKRI